MFIHPEVQNLDLISNGENSLVYRGIQKKNNQSVILKVLKREYPTLAQINRYKQEYNITNKFSCKNIIKVYKIEEWENKFIIFLEDFGGESLDFFLKKNKDIAIKDFLVLAIKIVDALSEIHQSNIIHKDINPSNIVYNSNTEQLKVIDFGISADLYSQVSFIKDRSIIEVTFAYISPEQTGKINHYLDYRTDFYSLGVTFYELLTQKLPFENETPIELIYSHIAKNPIPPNQINQKIPNVLSNIIVKLIAKNPNDRYQSSYGLKIDLEQCLFDLIDKKSIIFNNIGKYDVSGQFKLKQKLYGRIQETNQLLNSFKEIKKGGNKMVLISGYPGVGKSSLVNEISQFVLNNNCYYITGKFDQYQRNIPYNAFIRAFDTLIEYLLIDFSDKELNKLRIKLLEVLDVNVSIIIDEIPKLQKILGRHSKAPSLPIKEAQLRLKLVFQKFIKVFCDDYPLVIFIDDLQWCDMASLELLKILTQSSEIKYLLFIGAYRSNEVNSFYPLKIFLNELKKTKTKIKEIFLNSLNLSDIQDLIQDSFNTSSQKAKSFADLIFFKTNGNPFFVNEFLRTLYREKLLYFDFSTRSWSWDLELIKSKNITDNVIELLSSSIKKLKIKTQQILQVAACIGNEFDINTLAILTEYSLQEITLLLREAITIGLVSLLGDNYNLVESDIIPPGFEKLKVKYQFAHDRIRQAVYGSIPDCSKNVLHKQIGEYFLQKYLSSIEKLTDCALKTESISKSQIKTHKFEETSYEAISESFDLKGEKAISFVQVFSLEKRSDKKIIFNIVNHLNYGVDLICNKRDKNLLAQLNLIAGKQAKISAAFELSYSYLKQGIALLDTASWKENYKLIVDLHLELTETAYLLSHFKELKLYSQQVYQNAEFLDRIKMYEIEISSLKFQDKLKEALELGLYVLKLLKIKIPSNPNIIQLMFEFVKVEFRLRKKDISILADLPPMSEINVIQSSRIIQAISTAAYRIDPNIYCFIVLRQINLILRYGNCSASSIAFAHFGVILCSVKEDIKRGYQFGQLALFLLKDKQKYNQEYEIFTLYRVTGFLNPWKHSGKESLSDFLYGYNLALNVGNFEIAAYYATFYCNFQFDLQESLNDLLEKVEEYISTITRFYKKTTGLGFLLLFRQTIINLLELSEKPWKLKDKVYDQIIDSSDDIKSDDKTLLFMSYTYETFLSYLFENYENASINGNLARQHIKSIRGCPFVTIFYLWDSLSQIEYFKKTKCKNKDVLKKINFNLEKLKQVSIYCPENYSQRYYLVEARLIHVLGQYQKAIFLYEQAIALTKKNGFLFEEATAYELLAKLYLETHQVKKAEKYFKNAHYIYSKRGVITKIKHLENKYVNLLSQKEIESSDLDDLVNTSKKDTARIKLDSLDLASILQTDRDLSEEKNLDLLLAIVLNFSVKNVGAQTALIIPERDKYNLVKIAKITENKEVVYLAFDEIEKGKQYPQIVIDFVRRTQESLILSHAFVNNLYSKDTYITDRKVKSILCLPLTFQGNCVGILYLENNLSTNVFKKD
ncbi:MAG: AAA family ATPase, partial [Prochloraceae cyanobacterium]